MGAESDSRFFADQKLSLGVVSPAALAWVALKKDLLCLSTWPLLSSLSVRCCVLKQIFLLFRKNEHFFWDEQIIGMI